MAKFNKTVITKKGLEAIANIITDNDHLTFTKFKVSSKKYDYNLLEQLQDIEENTVLYELKKNNLSDDTIEVTALLTNENLELGYQLETIGLFAKDKSENEFLYSVTTAEISDFIPAYEGINVNDIYISLNIKVGSSDNTSVSKSMQGVVYEEDFDEFKDEIIEVIENIPEFDVNPKNIMINSSLSQSITGFNSSITESGTTNITDLYTYYSESSGTVNFKKNMHREYAGGFLQVTSVDEKGNSNSYIEVKSFIPLDCENNKYTLSFVARSISQNNTLKISVVDKGNTHIEVVQLTDEFKQYNFKVDKKLYSRNSLDLKKKNLIYIKIAFADEDVYSDENSSFEIGQLQIRAGHYDYCYLPKTLELDSEEITEFYCILNRGSYFPYNKTNLTFVVSIPLRRCYSWRRATLYGFLDNADIYKYEKNPTTGEVKRNKIKDEKIKIYDALYNVTESLSVTIAFYDTSDIPPEISVTMSPITTLMPAYIAFEY